MWQLLVSFVLKENTHYKGEKNLPSDQIGVPLGYSVEVNQKRAGGMNSIRNNRTSHLTHELRLVVFWETDTGLPDPGQNK